MNTFNLLFQTHKISVLIFLVIYLVKTILLLANKNQSLDQFKRITKIPEMIVSVLFLATGIYLITQIPEIKSLLIIKLVAVALSIPIAIIGFKKGNKALATLSLVLIIAAYGLAEMSKKQASAKKPDDAVIPATGLPKDSSNAVTEPATDATGFNAARARKLFRDNCQACHGADGKAKIAGASDLSVSTIDAMEAKSLVTDGKGSMPAFGDHLSSEEINATVNFIQSFKTKK